MSSITPSSDAFAHIQDFELTNALLHVADEVERDNGSYDNVLTISDYERYYRAVNPFMPPSSVIIERFGSWDDALAKVDLRSTPYTGPVVPRTTDEQLIEALRNVAKALGTDILSSHTYDEFRANNKDMLLPASSVIRKWLGSWKDAIAKAELSTPERAPRLLSENELLRDDISKHLRIIAGHYEHKITTQDYLQYRSTEQPHLPTLTTLFKLFSTWSKALEDAGLYLEDNQTEQ